MRGTEIEVDFGFTPEGFDDQVEGVATAIDRAPVGSITALTLEVAKSRWKGAHKRRMKAAIARHPTCRLTSTL